MISFAEAARRQQDYVVAMRRHFHMYPELGGEEFSTQRTIATELEKIGLTPKLTAGTGVVADLVGDSPGKMVALRADMDALPILDGKAVSYRSRNAGVCHACGHDGHMAMLLGEARVLTEMRRTLAGTVRFVFQPSEEKFPSGALAMIAEGAMTGVDHVLGVHLWQPLESGVAGISRGVLMASPDEFTITVKGMGGHGSMPQDTVCALSTGAQIVCAMNTIVGRSLDPLESAVISPGLFRSGEVFNVTPAEAVIKGTIRSFNERVRARVWDRLAEICDGICRAAGATYSLEKMLGHPPVINHGGVAAIVAEAAAETVGVDRVREISPVMGGEDFAYFLQQAPGMFLFLGIGQTDPGGTFPHHHPQFDIDEAVLTTGVEILARSTCKLLNR